MCMTQMPFKTFLLTFTLFLTAIPVVYAEKNSTTIWPKTFSGQPDFDFSRENILEERIKKSKDSSTPFKQQTLKDVLIAKDVHPVYQPVQASKDVSGTILTSTEDALEEISLLSELSNFKMLTTELPDMVSRTELIDLSEFEAHLQRVIERTIKETDPQFNEHNFNNELKRMSIQAISISPKKYAIINNQRYTEGERFQIPIQVMPIDQDIANAVTNAMPNKLSMTEDNYALYTELQQKVLANYAQTRTENPNSLLQTHPVTVTIKRIQRRKVTIRIFNTEYDLEVKFAL